MNIIFFLEITKLSYHMEISCYLIGYKKKSVLNGQKLQTAQFCPHQMDKVSWWVGPALNIFALPNTTSGYHCVSQFVY